MVNIKDPSNEWASFLGNVFMGLIAAVTFISFCFNMILGTNITHLLSLHLMLQLNNALPLMRAIPPLYLSYFYNKISFLNWQFSTDKSFYAGLFGKKGKMEAYNYTFEMQNISDSLLFINIFDMFLIAGAFLIFKGILALCVRKQVSQDVNSFNKMQKFNSQFSLFSFLRLVWLFLLTYSMLNLLNMAEQPVMIDYIGAAVSALIIVLSFVYLVAGLAKIKKFGPEQRMELSYTRGLKQEDRYTSAAWLIYLAKMMLIAVLTIYLQPLTRI